MTRLEKQLIFPECNTWLSRPSIYCRCNGNSNAFKIYCSKK